MYINAKRRSKRRVSIWGLIFAILFVSLVQITALPSSANIIDGVRDENEDMGGKVSDMARDAESGAEEFMSDVESKAEEIVTDAESKLDDASDGKVEDSDGFVGNETESAVVESSPENTEGMGKVGQVALIVLAVAAIIAVIVIVTVVSNKKKK